MSSSAQILLNLPKNVSKKLSPSIVILDQNSDLSKFHVPTQPLFPGTEIPTIELRVNATLCTPRPIPKMHSHYPADPSGRVQFSRELAVGGFAPKGFNERGISGQTPPRRYHIPFARAALFQGRALPYILTVLAAENARNSIRGTLFLGSRAGRFVEPVAPRIRPRFTSRSSFSSPTPTRAKKSAFCPLQRPFIIWIAFRGSDFIRVRDGGRLIFVVGGFKNEEIFFQGDLFERRSI